MNAKYCVNRCRFLLGVLYKDSCVFLVYYLHTENTGIIITLFLTICVKIIKKREYK